MKTLSSMFLLMAWSGMSSMADTMGVPDLPSDASTWTALDVFYAGFIAGTVVGGSALIVRFLRQPGKQNPEM